MPWGVAVLNTIVITCLLSSWWRVRDDTWTTCWLQLRVLTCVPQHLTKRWQHSCAPILSTTFLGEALWNTWRQFPKCCDGQGTGLRPSRNTFKQKSYNLKCFSFLDTMRSWTVHPQTGWWEMWPYQMFVEHCSPLSAPGPSSLTGHSRTTLLLTRSVPGKSITVRSRHFNLEKE